MSRMGSKDTRRRRAALMKRDKGICQICFAKIARAGEITIDHIIPRSMGGSNALTNLQLAHFRCNQWKNKHVDQVELKKSRPT